MLTNILRAVKSCFGDSKCQSKRPHNRRYRPQLEVLEQRDCSAVYTVTGLGDAGVGAGLAGDLRYCITQANMNAGEDTINFQTGLTGTIDTTSTLTITDVLHVNGPGIGTGGGPGAGVSTPGGGGGGGGAITIERDPTAGDFRLMDIGTVYVDIVGLTFMNGYASGAGAAGDGGAIRSAGNANILNCNFVNNQGDGNGGAVFNDAGGTMSISDTDFSDNYAFNGGAIASRGQSLDVAGCSIYDNRAALRGGGIYATLPSDAAGTLTVSGTEIWLCTSYSGGGICVAGGVSADINGGTYVHDNTAEYGGGISLDSASLTADDANIADNNGTTAGGGVYLQFAQASFSSTVWIANNVSGQGDGISYDADCLLLNDAVMINNTAQERM